jgi:hypothetical protein
MWNTNLVHRFLTCVNYYGKNEHLARIFNIWKFIRAKYMSVNIGSLFPIIYPPCCWQNKFGYQCFSLPFLYSAFLVCNVCVKRLNTVVCCPAATLKTSTFNFILLCVVMKSHFFYKTLARIYKIILYMYIHILISFVWMFCCNLVLIIAIKY